MAKKTITQNFVMGQNSAVVVNATLATEMTIRGMQGMGLCLGFAMETVKVSEMGRRIAAMVPSGGSYQETTVNYNFIPGDASLEFLRNASLNSTKITNIRMYTVAGCDFSAPDLISDPASGLYVGTMSDPKVDNPNGVYTGSLSYMPGGPFALFIAHIGGTTLSYTASTRTLADSGNGFVTAGFEVGDTIIIDKAPLMTKPIYAKISSVAAGAIVIEDGIGDEALMNADWAGASTTKIHGATPMVVSGVSSSCS